jgi:hypothetical protein
MSCLVASRGDCGFWGVTVRRRRPTRHGRLTGATALGGLSHILPVLGPLLAMWVHPGIRDIEE